MSVSLSDEAYCDLPWISVFVTVTGLALPCCDCRQVLGLFPQEDAVKVWEEGFDELRRAHNLGTPPPLCYPCCYALIGRVCSMQKRSFSAGARDG